MFIEITTAIGCRVNCSYCPQKKLFGSYHQPGRFNPDKVLTLANYKIMIDKVPSDIDINFAGMSEPFQNPDCVDMIIYAHKKHHLVRVYTTLRGLDPKNFHKLIKAVSFNNTGESRFIVHLPSAEEYKRIPPNTNYLEILEAVVKSKINAIYEYLGDDQLPTEVEALMKKYLIHVHYGDLISRAGNVDTNLVPVPTTRSGVIKCEDREGVRGHVILPDGSVLLCCMDYGMKHVLGNLITDSYKSIDDSPEMRKVLRGLEDPNSDTLCRNCELATDDKSKSTLAVKEYNNWQDTKSNTKKIIKSTSPQLYKVLRKIKWSIVPFTVSDKDIKQK